MFFYAGSNNFQMWQNFINPTQNQKKIKTSGDKNLLKWQILLSQIKKIIPVINLITVAIQQQLL